MMEKIHLEAQIPETLAGQRLDRACAILFPDYSRSRIKTWIQNGELTVNDAIWKPKAIVQGLEIIRIRAQLEQAGDWAAQDIALDIIYEDDDLLLINKSPGIVVHPAAGNADGTLLNAILHHQPANAGLPRGGIVHRLDKDTSGLMVVAKTLLAHNHLVAQLQDRSLSRQYATIVEGIMTAGDTIDAPMGRHPRNRIKMAVVANGKPAVTHYRIRQRFPAHTYLQVNLESGRTHQIRVHMAHIGHPVIGDPLYGGRRKLPKGISAELRDALQQFPRQALHAERLGLLHPRSGEAQHWTIALPEDMQALLTLLQQQETSS